MSKFLDYSQVVTPDQLDRALRAAGCDAVAHYLSGNFALRIEIRIPCRIVVVLKLLADAPVAHAHHVARRKVH